ncbi:PRC-barrel domain containing protein [Pseudohalocynthiibacter aestuariivivens]|uniref:PRC-barrel domain-containing protein n=1 Tax=Roseovarius pelagicus TaxID=2980108 RepID=A0ABY6DFP7_9RHOB|nr:MULTISPECIES: PRC-barrel domain-containing protein [Rhodobacterales]QIE46540.1 PRC-barrel domain containing protein [Pseudohalocynthiibacter aestuariivivens]UXX84938.1 PRC-barrel domain-containing protein [Roseovarius pelagicus]
MKNVITTLAASTLALSTFATVAPAQDASAKLMALQGDLIRTRDITGGSVFSTNAADDKWTNMSVDTAVGPDWNKIGQIEDIILTPEGQMVGIVAEIGGFLDIGDKHVVIATDDVKLVPTQDNTYAYVTRLSEDQLKTMKDVDEGFWN